jgi:hypothetical protein
MGWAKTPELHRTFLALLAMLESLPEAGSEEF